MPNPIIQNYLNDDSIPEEKRKKVFDALESGEADEAKLAQAIAAQFGDVYQPKSRRAPDGTEMSVAEFLEMQAADPNFRVNPGKIQRSGSRPSFQKATPQVNLKTRVRDALKGAYDAGKSGLDTLAGGVQNMRGSADMMNQSQEWAKQAQAEFEKDGDKAKFEKKMAVIQGLGNKANETRKLGQSQAFLGGIKTATSPITGTIGGALKPELQKIGEGAGNAFEGMSEKNKKRVLDAISAIKKVTKEHPVLTNYASGLFELGTIGVGGKAAKKTADMAIDATKATASMAGGLANAGLDATIGAGKFAKKGVDKLKAIKPLINAKSADKNYIKAVEFLTPEVNKRNLDIAAKESLKTNKNLVQEGTRGLITGSKDKILLTPRMDSAARTLSSKIDLTKTSAFNLPLKIKGEISKIAEPLRQAFKQVDVPVNLKTSIQNTWKKVKNEQLQSYNANKWLKDIHQTFEKDYINGLFKKLKDQSGKYRKKNVDDVWNMAIEYDNRYEKLIQSVEKGASDVETLTKYDAFLENRKILREAMDSMAETIDDINSKQAFKEMADLYEAQGQILKNLKPSNKPGTSMVGDALRTYKKEIATALGVGAVANAL